MEGYEARYAKLFGAYMRYICRIPTAREYRKAYLGDNPPIEELEARYGKRVDGEGLAMATTIYPKDIVRFTYGEVDLTNQTNALFIDHSQQQGKMESLEVKAIISIGKEWQMLRNELSQGKHDMVIEHRNGQDIKAEMVLCNNQNGNQFTYRLAGDLEISN